MELRSSSKFSVHFATDVLHEIDAVQLQTICYSSDVLNILEEDGGDEAALIFKIDETFVDVHDPKDVSTEMFWQQVFAFSEQMSGTVPGVATCVQRYFSRCSCLASFVSFDDHGSLIHQSLSGSGNLGEYRCRVLRGRFRQRIKCA